MASVIINGHTFEAYMSGSLVTPKDADIVQLNVDDLNFTLNFKFDQTEEVTVKFEKNAEKSLDIIFYNLLNPNGGSTDIAPVGNINGRPLSLSLMVHTIDGIHVTRLINYTFYLGET